MVLAGPRDTEMILRMIEPLAVIGEIALLDDSPRSAGLVAVTDCRSSESLARRSSVAQDPEFEDRLVAHVTSTLRRATEQLRAMYTFSSAERLAWCLAQVAGQRGQQDGDTLRISLEATASRARGHDGMLTGDGESGAPAIQALEVGELGHEGVVRQHERHQAVLRESAQSVRRHRDHASGVIEITPLPASLPARASDPTICPPLLLG